MTDAATDSGVSIEANSPALEPQRLAALCAQAMLSKDEASRALGVRLEDVTPGFARLRMVVRPEMLNGHGICHGGIIFTLADTAFALACNTYDAVTVAAAASIDFLAAAHANAELTAQARELWRSKRSGLYEVIVSNERGATLALFRGRSHCTGGRIISDPTR